MYLIIYVICFIWLFVTFLDVIFKSCMLHPYFRALHIAGVEIRPLMFIWTITRYNRFINRMGLFRRDILKTWFNIGAFVTCIIFFPSFFFYLYKLVTLFYTDTVQDFENSNVTPVIPGFNFPLSEWKLYLCIVLVISAFHEFGHALAASRLGISVDNFGFAVFIAAPVAFVNVRLDQLRHCSLWDQLTVFCAGIWHNIVLSISCIFVVKYFWVFLLPLYYIGGGVTVFNVNEKSGLTHPVYGFAPGDHIYAVGNCTVHNLTSWYSCLENLEHRPEGLCVPKEMLSLTTYATKMKCSRKQSHLYFYTELDALKFGTCLPARKSIVIYSTCRFTSECGESSACLVPLLSKSQKFIIFRRLDKAPILYEGYTRDLIMNVKISEFLPRLKFLTPSIPEKIQEFLQYVIIFSNGLAFLNVLPISVFDGVYIAENLIHMVFFNYLPYNQRKEYANYVGTFAIGVTISLAFLIVYKLYIFYA